MVTVILRGGLGNQMFEYAAGLAAARRRDTRLVLDTTYLNDRFPRSQFTYRTYDLDIFDLAPELTPLSRVSDTIPIPGLWLGLDLFLNSVKGAFRARQFIKEKKPHEFDPTVIGSNHASVVLWGFWQTPQYIIDAGIDAELRKAFTFKHPLGDEAGRIAQEIRNANSISIHVRRGDYLLPKYQSVYGATDISYYKNAEKYVARRVREPKFFVFSDDIAWCRDNLKFEHPAIYVNADSAGPKSSSHLHLMALCSHNIITNSSFSWWGAWLNGNGKKIVVAPALWDSNVPSREVIPPYWEIVQ